MCEEFRDTQEVHSVHLSPGVKPILACVYPWEDRNKLFEGVTQICQEPEQVDYYADPQANHRRGHLHNGSQTYVISSVSGNVKISTTYKDCTGLVVVGDSSDGSGVLSLLTHQDPRHFVRGSGAMQKKWVTDVTTRLTELRDRCRAGSIDCLIVGGKFLSYDTLNKPDLYDFSKSLECMHAVVVDTLGFEPVCLLPPGESCEEADVILETQNKRLHVVRCQHPYATSLPYTLSQLPKVVRANAGA